MAFQDTWSIASNLRDFCTSTQACECVKFSTVTVFATSMSMKPQANIIIKRPNRGTLVLSGKTCVYWQDLCLGPSMAVVMIDAQSHRFQQTLPDSEGRFIRIDALTKKFGSNSRDGRTLSSLEYSAAPNAADTLAIHQKGAA